jgi:hypothetical protein
VLRRGRTAGKEGAGCRGKGKEGKGRKAPRAGQEILETNDGAKNVFVRIPERPRE